MEEGDGISTLTVLIKIPRDGLRRHDSHTSERVRRVKVKILQGHEQISETVLRERKTEKTSSFMMAFFLNDELTYWNSIFMKL